MTHYILILEDLVPPSGVEQAIFDPHYDIDKLVALRGQKDALKERA